MRGRFCGVPFHGRRCLGFRSQTGKGWCRKKEASSFRASRQFAVGVLLPCRACGRECRGGASSELGNIQIIVGVPCSLRGIVPCQVSECITRALPCHAEQYDPSTPGWGQNGDGVAIRRVSLLWMCRMRRGGVVGNQYAGATTRGSKSQRSRCFDGAKIDKASHTLHTEHSHRTGSHMFPRGEMSSCQ